MTLVLIAITVLLVVYVIWQRQPKQDGYPHGPLSLPILGSLLHIVYFGAVDRFMQYYWSIFGSVGSQPLVEMIRSLARF